MHIGSRLTLNQRLFGMGLAMLAALGGVAALVWVLMKDIAATAGDVKELRVAQMQRIGELELDVTRASLQLRHAILARNAEERDAALADIASRREALEKRLADFGSGMVTDAGRQAYAPLPALMQSFWEVGTRNVQLIRDGRKDEAFAFLVEQTIPARNKLLTPLGAEKKRQGDELAAGTQRIADEALQSRSIVLGAVFVLAAGLALFSAYVSRVMRRLGGEPDALKRVADAVAGGDLAAEVPLRPGDTSSIMAALKTMRDRLAGTVQAVRDNADSVANASVQIASGNADLSARTERQASALQQTASSMEQLGSTVKLNADNARQANQLAQASSAVAEQGGAKVREVVQTMRGINESSRRIAEIIGTIDGIAFQTNILALNAAVEAARAGEQGRGFAVVAGEVRSLAQRSADAAKEIKSLIGTSVERVEQGSALVDAAGATMQEIVESIQRVAVIVGEIASASAEQSQGVGEVGQAVSQMDQATQQNAALVEESAAAAESLKQQARQLVQAVASFRLRAA